MTEKRFQWVYIKDELVQLRDNGVVKIYPNERLEELLNDLNNENEQLRQVMGFMQNDNTNDILNVLNSQEDMLKQLRNENEQLKKENHQLKQLIQAIISKEFEISSENNDYDPLTEFFKNEVSISQIEVDIDVEKEEREY